MPGTMVTRLQKDFMEDILVEDIAHNEANKLGRLW